MSNTLRKDKNGKVFKESIKKHNGRTRCRCEYCSGVDRNELFDKISEKEIKEQIKVIEQGEHLDFDIPEQDEIIEQIFGRI
jgi:hypothetical protein